MAYPSQNSNHHTPPKKLPTPRSVQYFDADKKLNPALMDTKAEEVAQELRSVSTTQLRRFYEDVINLRQRLAAEVGGGQAPDQAFNVLRADFKMLKAKAFYAHGRSLKSNQKTFPEEMLQFFVDHVAAVKDAADFEAFCKHFQAVVAFHKFYGEK